LKGFVCAEKKEYRESDEADSESDKQNDPNAPVDDQSNADGSPYLEPSAALELSVHSEPQHTIMTKVDKRWCDISFQDD
jgi:hypothetical protein